MMDARTEEALKRTWKTLVRHLEDLNDQVEHDGGRIKHHMVLDGIKDAVKSLKCLHVLMEGSEEEVPEEGPKFVLSSP